MPQEYDQDYGESSDAQTEFEKATQQLMQYMNSQANLYTESQFALENTWNGYLNTMGPPQAMSEMNEVMMYDLTCKIEYVTYIKLCWMCNSNS